MTIGAQWAMARHAAAYKNGESLEPRMLSVRSSLKGIWSA